MNTIYFDNSATTPLIPEAREKMLAAMDIFGNPSSLHTLGVEAEKLVHEARRSILAALGVKYLTALDGRQLIFTASGTEADNLALLGAAGAKDFPRGKRVIISDSEHPAIMETAKELERRGFVVTRIPTRSGVPDYDAIEFAADSDTILASFMLVNNETGAVYDIKRISDIVKRANPSALIHTDCTQGFLKRRFTARSLGADMITLSGHKIGASKGIGALWVSPDVIKRKALAPIIFGGGQESGMRSGTENVIGIAGFGAAAKAGFERLDENTEKISKIRERLIELLSDEKCFPGVALNLPAGEAAPHILSVRLPMIRSEVMLHSLSHSGVFVSSGSACSSNTGHGSYVLKAFGLSDREADCTIRLSLGAQNTLEEADRFAEEFSKSLSSLARMTK